MRVKRYILSTILGGYALCLSAQSASILAQRLLNTPEYINDATFEVLLPSASDPITYTVTLQSESPVVGDTLAPCNYLIRWETTTNSGPIEGFSAYYDGNHYRYRNNRLQEYHVESNQDAFMPLGPGSTHNGVQSTAQFADMLPQFLGSRISEMLNDSAYVYQFHPDTIVHGKKAIVVDGVKRGNGYDLVQYTYVFDPTTYMPVYTDIVNSPGAISEQLVTVTYGSKASREAVEISEDGLMEAWPEVFEKYRESTFRAESLANTPLPGFACRTLDDERYAHHVNEPFDSPVIIVALDPSVASTEQTVAAIREAMDMAPMDIQVIWAMKDNDVDAIRSVLGTLNKGEIALVSANSLIRNCGITLYPTTILTDKASKVHDVISGYNNDLGLVVLQKAMLLK